MVTNQGLVRRAGFRTQLGRSGSAAIPGGESQTIGKNADATMIETLSFRENLLHFTYMAPSNE
jgi:hypothetical protein